MSNTVEVSGVPSVVVEVVADEITVLTQAAPASVVETSSSGPQGAMGPAGPASTVPGPTGPAGATGAGVAAGGLTGQVLAKVSDDDYDTTWVANGSVTSVDGRTGVVTLSDLYDTSGSSAAAQSAAQSYADGLAVNYDPAGSAGSAQAAAEAYADGLAVNYDPAGSAGSVASDLSDHESATTSVHGISDTTNLVYTSDSRLSDARTPTAHKTSHATGGSDALTASDIGAAPATGISPSAIAGTAVVDNDARLSDARTPTAHKTSHATGGSDALSPSDIGAAPATGISPSAISGTAVVDSDSRLSDARTPTAHASSHGSAGSDPITVAQSQVTNLTSDLGGKASTTDLSTHTSATTSVHGISDTANLVYTSDSRLSDARTPTAHKSSHATGGSDALSPSDIGAAPESGISPSAIAGTAVVDNDARLSDARTPTDGSVSTAKIIDGAVTNAKLENDSITLNGSPVSLGGSATIDGLPSQTGNSGKFLTTDGTSASWATAGGATPDDDSLIIATQVFA